MTYRPRVPILILAALLIITPAMVEAGPPLICHPFQTSGVQLLPWGSGPDWNNPDRRYDLQRLTADTLSLLAPQTPVLARMEILRRAAIYAVADQGVAARLLQALLSRAQAPNADATALFDAGYLVEAYRQSTHMHGRKAPAQNGYDLVVRAIALTARESRNQGALEFAASLMSQGGPSRAHLERARAAASAEPLLAQNIEVVWR